MRTTLILKDSLVKKAMELSSIKEKTALVHAGLEALIAQLARQRLIALGGSDKTVKAPSRRRSR
ncbi:MAG: type II toxin-antitoxin system VapB family antitoxin [Oligoflexales bacterium]|nr:type II toxin-antitoxin system VapB family antitoxin [Oligoflexales bacterium]